MKACTTSDRLHSIMEERNMKQVDILERARPFCEKTGVKLGKNDLSQYVSGKVEPGQEKLSILSMALGVSETWLMGYDVQKSRAGEEPVAADGNGQLAEAASLFTDLSNEKKRQALDYLRFLASFADKK